MKFTADLHVHSRFSMATSRTLSPETLHSWCRLKGLTVVGTGDFTHPAWFSELKEKLSPAEPGLFRLKPELAPEVPEKCRAEVRFLLQAEVNCVYEKSGRPRRIHQLLYAPSFESAAGLNAQLGKFGNLSSDGRPTLKLDSENLLETALSAGAHLVPAHVWTPHFGIFGSASGFDCLAECFGELAPFVFAIETGLSSDPEMNRRVSSLDEIALISNSDAHSPEKLGREANVFDAELSFAGIFSAVKKRRLKTLEFFAEEGKYYSDGHRKCGVRLAPKETVRLGGLCPKCGKKVTSGVLSRIEKFADRLKGKADFESLVPLKEILAQSMRANPKSAKVGREYMRLLTLFGNELFILRKLPPEKLRSAGFPLAALAVERMRSGKAAIQPGYDGEYGSVGLLGEKDFAA